MSWTARLDKRTKLCNPQRAEWVQPAAAGLLSHVPTQEFEGSKEWTAPRRLPAREAYLLRDPRNLRLSGMSYADSSKERPVLHEGIDPTIAGEALKIRTNCDSTRRSIGVRFAGFEGFAREAGEHIAAEEVWAAGGTQRDAGSAGPEVRVKWSNFDCPMHPRISLVQCRNYVSMRRFIHS